MDYYRPAVVAVIFFILGYLLAVLVVPTFTEEVNTSEGLIDTSFSRLAQLNDFSGSYPKISDCTPGKGVIYSPAGFGISILTVNQRVIGVVGAWPAEKGWYSWADQTEGSPFNSPKLGSIYTQTIFFERPPTVEECVALS